MENKQYFILEDNIQKGPFTIDELINAGYDANTKIWHSGLEKWTKASKVPELQEALIHFPPNRNYSKKWLVIALVIIMSGFGIYAASKYWQGSNHTPVTKETPHMNNQQLYTLFSPGVVLIQHRYMYEINTGIHKFFFHEYLNYDNIGYLSGLTRDSIGAALKSQPLQGTGFFVNKNGMILTNRHVAQEDPSAEDQENIARALIHQLNDEVDYETRMDSIRTSKAQNDSLLASMLRDTLVDAAKIADLRLKIAEAQQILDEEKEWEGENEHNDSLLLSQDTVSIIAAGEISVKKITLDLRIFLPGTRSTKGGNGIECKIIANSNEPEVDLALLQVENERLPDQVISIPDLSRIENADQGNALPQMSERLILIGYNSGSALSTTSEGLKAQLTEGKISQNTDIYKLMYTIPTLPGSSGSPVLDDKGRLVSVNFAGISYTQSFNYGIQPRKIWEFLKSNNVSI